MTLHHDSLTANPPMHIIGLSRTVVAQDHISWLVREMSATPSDHRRTPTLLFETGAVIRRVRNYPADWRELSDLALMQTSWLA